MNAETYPESGIHINFSIYLQLRIVISKIRSVHEVYKMYQSQPAPSQDGRSARIKSKVFKPGRPVVQSHEPNFQGHRTRLTVPTSDPSQPFALLFINLDQFRTAQGPQLRNINPEALAQYRDRLLIKISEFLTSQLRDDDLISHVGSTDFVIALRLDPLVNVPQVASRIANLFNQPITLDELCFQVSCSIGISFYPEDGQDTNELVAKAYSAMHEAKIHGLEAVRLHPSKASNAIRRRLQIERALKHPNLIEQLEVVYQPQWDCIGDRLYGFEGLVRWHHPTLGTVSPQEFIPIAEELGCIHRITSLVVTESLRLARDILVKYDLFLRPSVNVSAQEFEECHSLYETIDTQLRRYQLPGNLLTIELTERVFLQPSEQIIANMSRFRDRGIYIALDDFGTGFSCLNYLLDLPLNILKIDRTFVQNLDQDQRRRGVVQAIAAMAKSLDMNCVAEGVETTTELDCLQAFSCALIQGHLVSPALPASAFRSFIAATRTRPFLNP